MNEVKLFIKTKLDGLCSYRNSSKDAHFTGKLVDINTIPVT